MKVPFKEKYAFGLGALGKDAVICFVGTFLAYYYTDVLYLTPAFVGALFFAARIWDAINDPMMGMPGPSVGSLESGWSSEPC